MPSKKSILVILALFLMAGLFSLSNSVLDYPQNNIGVELQGENIESMSAANLHLVFPGYSTLGVDNGKPASIALNLRDIKLKQGFGILQVKYTNNRYQDPALTPRVIAANENCHATYVPSKSEFRLRADNNSQSCSFDLQFRVEGMLYPAGRIGFDTSDQNISETSLTFRTFPEYYVCESSTCISTLSEGTRAFRKAYDSHQFENTSQALEYLSGENQGAEDIRSKIAYKAVNEEGNPITATLFFDSGKTPSGINNILRNVVWILLGAIISFILYDFRPKYLRELLDSGK